MSTITPVPRARPGGPGDHKRWIVSAALFAPLLLLLLVTVRTWRAELRYAAVTHRVVHDFASIAAWQYSRGASTALHDETMRAFSGIAKGHQRTGSADRIQPPAAILAHRPTRDVAFLEHARFTFAYDASSRILETAGRTVDDDTRAMLLRRLSELSRTARSVDEPHRVLFDSSGGAAHAIALWMIHTADGPLRAVYGVVADPRALRNRFNEVIREANLLPAINDSAIDETDVAVRLSRKDGGIVFATAQSLGPTAAIDSTGLESGELLTAVDLSPRLANVLLVGGTPPSQLPSLALMIVVATVLAGIGLVQERRSRELARLRTRFVTNVSHELRTPLAQISMFAETLALGRERSVGEGREFASIIFAEARRLTGLVESVLKFSRLESGREMLRVEHVDIAAEVTDVVEAFMPIAQAADAMIALHLRDDTFAQLDRAAFRQIILNLLDNAVKHGGRGTSVDISAEQHNGDVRIMVDDSGPGVPTEWRERVFEPFVRLERGSAAGAGIGLAVVCDLVAAHGGRVWIEQSPSGGARFTVAVAAAHPSAPVALAESLQTRA